MNVDLSRIHFPIRALGPGDRIGIWFQGCSIRCPGCISLDTWPAGKGTTTVDEVIGEASSHLPKADGITVTGGEPFDQPEPLLAILRGLRARGANDILVYSGYPFSVLKPKLPSFDGLIDVLIAEPFHAGAPATLALRGSDNQKMHFLTPAGEARFGQFDRKVAAADRHLDVMFDVRGADVWIAGIPGRGDLSKLKHRLAQAGHRICTTEQK